MKKNEKNLGAAMDPALVDLFAEQSLEIIEFISCGISGAKIGFLVGLFRVIGFYLSRRFKFLQRKLF